MPPGDGDERCDFLRENADAAATTVQDTAPSAAAVADGAGLDEYEVVLAKGVCGFGIYFTAAADGTAIVDPVQPFYRLPDGSEAPGEASGRIQPTDTLRAINGKSVESYAFADVVEELRRTPLGDATLRFKRVLDANEEERQADPPPHELQQKKSVRWKLFDWPAPTSTTDTDPTTKVTIASPYEEEMLRAAAMEELLLEMQTKIRALEEDVEREKKCRFLAEKKNILYRNALRSLSDDNAQLRYQLTLEKHAHDATQHFQSQKLHLSV